jgi:hypothetical protein
MRLRIENAVKNYFQLGRTTMFIAKYGERLRMVRQDDHAVHAGEVTKYWGNEKFERTSAHDSVTTAVRLHDIGWQEPDDQVLYHSETGLPVNFIDVDVKKHVEFYRNGFLRVTEIDPHAGLLVGMHWIGLYTKRFGYDPTLTYTIPEHLVSYMDSVMAKEQKGWTDIKERLWKREGSRGEFEDTLWMQYEIVQVMDRISQVMSLKDPELKNEELLGRVRQFRKGELLNLSVKSNGDGKIIVDPFPFTTEFEANVPCIYIPDRVYESQEELQSVVRDAKKEWVCWRVVAG